MVKISLLVTTYNDPDRLEKTLSHYLRLALQPFEILVCDDGSKVETKNLVDSFIRKSRTPIIHVYQEDHGWDPSGIRNLGTLQASGDYLIFTDGDCVPHPQYIHDHLQAAETGCFVFGDRSHVLQEHIDRFTTHTLTRLSYILTKKINKRQSALRNPFEKPEVREKSAFRDINALASLSICCNFAMWKQDLVAVNGFDESFNSWWPEDAECAARLLNRGLKLKKYRQKCLVYHLNHGDSSVSCPEKYQFAETSLLSGKLETSRGIKQHLAGAGTPPAVH